MLDNGKNFGDTTVVYWAEKTSADCQDCFSEILEPNNEISNKILNEIMAGVQSNKINFGGYNFPKIQKDKTASLFQNAILRLKSEHEITYERAAIIKAYLTRNKGRENLMALDENSTDRNYILGRIFSVLEAIQAKANPNLNATIKDKYFTAACAAPNRILPNLQKLSINHLKKLKLIAKTA